MENMVPGETGWRIWLSFIRLLDLLFLTSDELAAPGMHRGIRLGCRLQTLFPVSPPPSLQETAAPKNGNLALSSDSQVNRLGLLDVQSWLNPTPTVL